ncbi:hypothetical protein CEXT_453071 [Caerostris extrusa]|uniref:RNase H type-1 domain-containing protein n=1 Tax=Caerostris extrusa TaxID=172846 RepID=A0AAV4XWI0_CAEEX|nr:hypothetical protein CEXT_453071 [Caerostris extrusa]
MALQNVGWQWEKNTSNYDGEICGIQEAAKQLLSHELPPRRVVSSIDSQATISTLSSNSPSDCQNTIQCCAKPAEWLTSGWVLHLQWVPMVSHRQLHQQKPQGSFSPRREAFKREVLTNH